MIEHFWTLRWLFFVDLLWPNAPWQSTVWHIDLYDVWGSSRFEGRIVYVICFESLISHSLLGVAQMWAYYRISWWAFKVRSVSSSRTKIFTIRNRWKQTSSEGRRANKAMNVSTSWSKRSGRSHLELFLLVSWLQFRNLILKHFANLLPTPIRRIRD